jgi:hypothetical protein
MRLLLDECVPKRLKRHLSEHDVQTVPEAGWAGLKNGALLRVARSNDIGDLEPLLPAVREALATVRQGEVIRVEL